ncbi:MAG: hypothetical protein ABSB22_17485 [Thermodesulfobacteriota bacterium]
MNRRKSGWVISEVTLKDILESYELRKLIEVAARKQSCLNCPAEIIDEMKRLVDEAVTLFRCDEEGKIALAVRAYRESTSV